MNITKLAVITVMSLLFAWVICYGAMKTAEQIAKPINDRIEAMQ